MYKFSFTLHSYCVCLEYDGSKIFNNCCVKLYLCRRANEEILPGFSSDDEMEECSSDWLSLNSVLIKDSLTCSGGSRRGN